MHQLLSLQNKLYMLETAEPDKLNLLSNVHAHLGTHIIFCESIHAFQHAFRRPFTRKVRLDLQERVIQSIKQVVTHQPIIQSVNHTITQSASQLVGDSVTHSAGQSISLRDKQLARFSLALVHKPPTNTKPVNK